MHRIHKTAVYCFALVHKVLYGNSLEAPSQVKRIHSNHWNNYGMLTMIKYRNYKIQDTSPRESLSAKSIGISFFDISRFFFSYISFKMDRISSTARIIITTYIITV